MSGELVRDCPDLAGLTWCDGGGALTATEPDPGLKATGYAEDDKPSQPHWNWRERQQGRLAEWLTGSVVRRFDRLDIALAATTPAVPVGAEFAVSPATITPRYVRTTVKDLTADTPTFHATATDGVRVFAAYTTGGGAFRVKAYHRVAGVWTELWSYTPGAAVICMCCDGARVFIGINTSAAANVIMLNALTGAVLDSKALTSSALPTAIACSGTVLAVGAQDATNATVKEFSYSASALTLDYSTTYGTIANSAIVHALAISPYYDATTNTVLQMVIAAGDKGTASADVICELIYHGSVLKNVAAGGGAAFGVACDGRRIFIAHESYEVVPASGLDAYIQCRALYDAKLLWVGPDSADNAKQPIAWDGRRLYVPVGAAGAEAPISVFEPHQSDSGYIMPEFVIDDSEFAGGCDGANLITIDRSGGASDTFLSTLPLAPGPRRFVRVADNDPNRLPGYCLAQPVE